MQDLTDISEIDAKNSTWPGKKDEKSTKKEIVKTIGYSIKKDAQGEIEDEFQPLNASFILNENERQMYDMNDFLVDDDDDDDDENMEDAAGLAKAKESRSRPKRSAATTTIGDEENLDNVGLYASINQYKSKFLGSVRGMNEFKEFLRDEAQRNEQHSSCDGGGYRLLKFWLDCEFYRDSMQDYDEIENMATRTRLYRDLVERYVFHFERRVHEKISAAYHAPPAHRLTFSVFERIQYDVLRRLRAYWVPRFILGKLKQRGKPFGVHPLPPLTPDFSRQSTYMSGMAAAVARNNKALPSSATASDAASSLAAGARIFSAKLLEIGQREYL